MESLKRRMEKLEACMPRRGAFLLPRYMERYFHAHENARRELHGLEPLPDLLYTREDREDDQRTLEATIPAYRNGGGWETGESRAFLNGWERDIRERLYREE